MLKVLSWSMCGYPPRIIGLAHYGTDPGARAVVPADVHRGGRVVSKKLLDARSGLTQNACG